MLNRLSRILTIGGLFLLIFSFFVYSESSYLQPGGTDQDFNQGDGRFNSDITEIYNGRTLTTRMFSPLIGDLDNDGLNEIVILSGDTLRVYQNSTLQIVDTVDLNCDLEDIAPPILFNIDGGSDIEIITICAVGGTGTYKHYKLVAGSLVEFDSEVTFPGGVLEDFQTWIQCRGVNDCMLFKTDTTMNIQAIPFNSTNISQNVLVVQSGGADDYCFPNIRTNAVFDLDGNGEKFFVSAFRIPSSGNEQARIYAIDSNGTNALQYNDFGGGLTSFNLGNIGLTPDDNCIDDNEGSFITSPLGFDYDTGEAGNEILIGSIEDNTNSFRLFSFEKDGTFLDDHPEITDGEGRLVSNLMVMNAFSSNADPTGICVLGYDQEIDELDLICGSRLGTGIQSREFTGSQGGNITFNYTSWSPITHAVQTRSTLINGVNLHEIITTFGSFQIGALGDPLTRDWVSEKIDVAYIPIDYDNDGQIEIIGVNDQNVFFVTDGFVNTNCDTANCIRSVSTNPCILDSVGLVNSSLSVSVVADDVEDGDQVAVKIDMYVGGTNEHTSGWSNNASSGTTFTFTNPTIAINQTISAGVMIVRARDTNDPSKIDSETFTFSVSDSGFDFGECISTSIPSGVTEEETTTATGEGVDDAITNVVDDISEEIGIQGTTFWFILMTLAPIVLLWVFSKLPNVTESSLKIGLLIIAIFEIFMMVLGVRLGFISTGLLITITVLAGGVIAVAIATKTFQSNG